MSTIVINRALLEQFIEQLKFTLNQEYHVVPTDPYRYRNPSCLRGHISTTSRDLGDPFTEDQIDLINAHLCSFIHFSKLRSMADKAPCMLLYGFLGLRDVVINRLMAMLTVGIR